MLSNLPARLPAWLAVLGFAAVLSCALLGRSTSTTHWVGLLLALAGLQLGSLALIGRQLGRLYDEARRRPRWLVADRVGFAPTSAAPRRLRRSTASTAART